MIDDLINNATLQYSDLSKAVAGVFGDSNETDIHFHGVMVAGAPRNSLIEGRLTPSQRSKLPLSWLAGANLHHDRWAIAWFSYDER